MTISRLMTRLQRMEQTAARQAQQTRIVLVKWHEGEETEAEAWRVLGETGKLRH